MSFLHHIRKRLVALVLVLLLVTTTSCAGATQADRVASRPNAIGLNQVEQQVEQGNTPVGQEFGAWVVQAAGGMVQDAYVRDNNKLGVVVSSKVRPNEVRSLAKSLAQGFHKNFPDRNLSVLMYAPDKQLILKAQYDNSTNQIEYQAVSS